MKLRTQYILLAFGLFCATFLTFFLLGSDIIESLIFATINMCLFLIYICIMVQTGRWRL